MQYPRFLLATALASAALPGCFLNSSAYESGNGSPATSSGTGAGGAGGETTSTGVAGDDTTTGTGAGGAGGTGASGGSLTGGTGTGGVGGTGGAGGTGGTGGGPPVVGDLCPGIPTSIALYAELLLDNGDTTMATGDSGSTCGGGAAPEVVYAVTALQRGYLTATLEQTPAPWGGFVYIRGGCADPLSTLGCGDAPFKVLVEKDQTVFVFVDGHTVDAKGTFKLHLYLDGCGNGILETAQEECDDGNLQFLDGCSDTCDVECDCPAGTNCSPFEDDATHHCYAVVKSPDADWPSAKSKCEMWGGTLAVLATQAEIDMAQQKMSVESNDVWIGGSDIAVDGTFTWVIPTEPWIYQNGSTPPWESHFAAASEPNGGVNENCVEIYKSNGHLNDEGCGDTHDYLCERAPAGETPANSGVP